MSFDVVNRWRSDSLNQLLKSYRSWEIGVTPAVSFRSLAVATDCNHCCLISVGYLWMNFTECKNNA